MMHYFKILSTENRTHGDLTYFNFCFQFFKGEKAYYSFFSENKKNHRLCLFDYYGKGLDDASHLNNEFLHEDKRKIYDAILASNQFRLRHLMKPYDLT